MAEPADREDTLRAFVTRLGLDIDDFGLLDRALTHASALGDSPHLPGNNESLEFLGDAVLDLAVAEWLFEHRPELPPGDYTQMRARVVNKRTLAEVAKGLDLAGCVRLGKGEDAAGGRQRPGLLADCMEALLGAVFLDAGWPSARDFALRILKSELETEPTRERDWDFRSQLQNYCQAHGWPLPEFQVTRETGPDHDKHFEVAVRVNGPVRGSGEGKSKKEAEQNAARAALDVEGQR